MTLDEAMVLAREIDAHPEAILIAIGRFKSVDELTSGSPWGCSIRFAEANCICWTRETWTKVAGTVPVPSAPTPAEEPPRPDHKHRQQLSLF